MAGIVYLFSNMVNNTVEHVQLPSCVVAYGVCCSITGGKRERVFLLLPPCRHVLSVLVL
jgi:hypothetical protein